MWGDDSKIKIIKGNASYINQFDVKQIKHALVTDERMQLLILKKPKINYPIKIVFPEITKNDWVLK